MGMRLVKFNTKILEIQVFISKFILFNYDGGQCHHQDPNSIETQNTFFLMNETLWNAISKAPSLALINQADP